MSLSTKDLVEGTIAVLENAGRMISRDTKMQKTILGTYTNGKARSVVDALSGEIVSPEDRLAITNRLKEHEKKKKKKKKKGKKYAKIDLGE